MQPARKERTLKTSQEATAREPRLLYTPKSQLGPDQGHAELATLPKGAGGRAETADLSLPVNSAAILIQNPALATGTNLVVTFKVHRAFHLISKYFASKKGVRMRFLKVTTSTARKELTKFSGEATQNKIISGTASS